jgi:DNA-binding XRE family transcriptional regulator
MVSKISEREKDRRRTQAARDEALRNRDRLLYTRREVAALYGVSVETLIRLENEGRLTPLKLTAKPGGMVLYKAAEIHELAGAA